MRKIKEVLRLHYEQHRSHREISRSVDIGLGSVSHYLKRASAAKISWPLPDGISDQALYNKLFDAKEVSKNTKALLDFAKTHQELKKKGVTLQLLWYEYKEAHPEGYSYSRYCGLYQKYCSKLNPSMRITHHAGEKLFVDYSGLTIDWIERETGIVHQAEVFVAVLGASNYTYVEACESQSLKCWINAHIPAFEFFQGVPCCVVPDNLKAGITKAHLYDPDVNASYQEMANYYGIAVVPARIYSPKDKPKVEVGVQGIQRWIIAPLRHMRFFSIEAINQAFAPLLKSYNERPFQELEGCRLSQYTDLDRPALKSLPATRYYYAQWKKAKAGIDYHVTFEKHHYSIPYQYLKEKIDLRITQSTIECFHQGLRIAIHQRSYKPGHTTLKEHIPKAHQAYVTWTPERLKAWALKTGPYTQALIEELINLHKIPEQSFRACLGILRLGQRYGKERLEQAAYRGLKIGAIRYRNIASILSSELDKQPLNLPESEAKAETTRPHHENVRGAEYYH